MSSKRTALTIAVTSLVVVVVLAYRIRRMRDEPSALPYSQLLFTELPRPLVTRAQLREMLQPVAGQRVLEIGPGAGYYSLHAADWISPDGSLEILDVEQRMLDHTAGRAHEFGIDKVIATQGDARELPYKDSSFDAAYLVATLGEVPEREPVLKELHRVLKPGARLVVGEGQPDPHMVSIGDLQSLARAEGFAYEKRIGNPFGYFASFTAT